MAFQSKLKSMQPRRLQYRGTIKLVSGGYIRPESFPNGEITVYPWDTDIDDWFNERIKKGESDTILFDTCAKLCDLNGCPLDTFLMGDLNAVLLAARALKFKDGVVEYDCPCPNQNCKFTTREMIKVPKELGMISPKTSDYPGFDIITLPDSEDIVTVRPLQIKDERNIIVRDAMLKKAISDHVMHILTPIVSINDGRPDSWDDVLRWFGALSPSDCEYLEEQQNALNPHLDTNVPHICDKCQTKFKHNIDFSTQFFRPSLKPGSRTQVAPDVRPSVELKGAGNQPQGSAGPNTGNDGGVGQRENRGGKRP